MRETARRLLGLGRVPPLVEDLADLTAILRGQVELLVPEIQALIHTFPEDDVPAAVAQVGTDAAYRQAKKLAMSVCSLCDHYENLRRPATF